LANTQSRGRRKIVVGQVVSDRPDKTITVEVGRRVPHPLYGKVVRRTSRFAAHDETNDAHTGDRVSIVESRPLSKTKRWRLVRVIERAR
jgi:small subunit ribosomal protein S17